MSAACWSQPLRACGVLTRTGPKRVARTGLKPQKRRVLRTSCLTVGSPCSQRRYQPGESVVSSTRGVLARVADYGLGGKQVWVIGPAGERHYYAHLDGFAADIARNVVVRPGSLLGYVGDTGNARGTPPHLHYGIYAAGGAYNPWPLLQAHRNDDASATPRSE